MGWFELVIIAFTILTMCAACWREGRLSGFDRGIERGVEIGKGSREEP